MISRRPEVVWRTAILVLGAWIVFGIAGLAWAQHTPDPYNIVGEYNNQYEPYMYANYPTAPGTQPNQGRYDGRSGLRSANSFQSFVDSEEGDSGDFGRPAPARPSGPGVPYYKAYRRFDQEFQRTYRPNESADRNYYNDQERRNDKYFQALREPDPRKRSQLLRDYNLDNMRAARDLSSGRTPAEKGEQARDRFAPGGASLAPEDTEKAEPRRATTTTPAPVRAPSGAAPLTAPPARGAPRSPAPPVGGSSAAPAPRSGRSSATPAPVRPGSTGTPSAADLLKRSELLDRAGRATAPTLRRSTAPPAR